MTMIGIDPHKATHTAVAVDDGEQVIGEFTLEASNDQAERLTGWADRFTKREWAVESANGLGYLIGRQLVAHGETVFDVPPVLAARVRLMGSGRSQKNDPNDARSIAIAALRSDRLAVVKPDDDVTVLRLLVKQQLGSISAADLNAWISILTVARYTPATVNKAFQLVAIIFKSAVESELLLRSPTRSVNLPRVERTEMRFLTADQVLTLADAVGSHNRALILTAAYTGLRWGEITGLRVQRLDLLKGTLTVTEAASEVRGHITRVEPKTAASRRTVALPRFLRREIASHLAMNPIGADGLVFTSPQVTALRRSNFRRRVWLPATRTAGVSGVRFHDLRHTHAAILIGQGEHPKVIQARLGHASITTTLDRYGHLFEGLDEAAADRLDLAWNQDSAPSSRPSGGAAGFSTT